MTNFFAYNDIAPDGHEMNYFPTLTPKRRLFVGITFSAVAVLSLTGAYALRKVFDRPGEAALRYVPADSVLVASIDLVPSPAQALAFKHIDDSLSRNQMGKLLEKSVLELVEQNKATESLRPLVLRSGAASISTKNGKPDPESILVFVAVSDGVEASKILQKGAYPQFYKGIKYYRTSKNSMGILVVDDLLVLSQKPEAFLKVKAIQSGEAKAITSVPEYVAATGNIASDANFFVYVSPKVSQLVFGDRDPKVSLPEWAAIGLAVRDGGIGMSCSVKSDVTKNSSYQTLAQIAPIRQDLFSLLPGGAYGMLALSNLSTYFDVGLSSFSDKNQIDKQLAEMEDSIQKGTGLSLKQDILPALKGDAVVAAYPSGTGAPVGADALIVIDDSNNANPADAVSRLKAFVEQQVAKEGNSPKLFSEKPIQGGTEYRINDKIEADMRKGIGNGFDDKTIKKSTMAGDKTVVFALVGKSILAATSQDLLDRAVASYESKTNGLIGDAKFGPYEHTLLDGSQTFAAFSLARISEGIKNTVGTSNMDRNGREVFTDILDAFSSLNQPLSITGKTSADGVGTGGVFIPLDYDKVIDLIGNQRNKHH